MGLLCRRCELGRGLGEPAATKSQALHPVPSYPCSHPHFAVEKTKAQRVGVVSYPQSHHWLVPELLFETRSVSRACPLHQGSSVVVCTGIAMLVVKILKSLCTSWWIAALPSLPHELFSSPLPPSLASVDVPISQQVKGWCLLEQGHQGHVPAPGWLVDACQCPWGTLALNHAPVEYRVSCWVLLSVTGAQDEWQNNFTAH